LPMTCHSGGSVDIYLEPVLPAPRLLLFGDSPCARALAQLGGVMGYHVEVGAGAAPLVSGRRTFAVVATMGESDESSVATALAVRPAYLGVVASRKRFVEMRDALLARGIAAADLDAIRNPAGLDIGAHTPEEVALSILAEVLQLRRAETLPAEPVADTEEAIDPVCGMSVQVEGARHRTEHQGRIFYFCNARCRERFLAAPAMYVVRAAEGAR
jgi:xanthine dehydrogenase accessory factor